MEKNLTFKQQIGSVGDSKRLLRIVVSDKDADVFLLEMIDHRLDILDCNGVDTGKRFVEHYELRVYGQTAGNLRASALATRQLVAEIVAHFSKAELRDKAFKLVALIFCRGIGHLKDCLDIVLDREFTEYARLLGKIADAVLGTLIDGVFRDV